MYLTRIVSSVVETSPVFEPEAVWAMLETIQKGLACPELAPSVSWQSNMFFIRDTVLNLADYSRCYQGSVPEQIGLAIETTIRALMHYWEGISPEYMTLVMEYYDFETLLKTPGWEDWIPSALLKASRTYRF